MNQAVANHAIMHQHHHSGLFTSSTIQVIGILAKIAKQYMSCYSIESTYKMLKGSTCLGKS